ncbi:MAG: metallophosphoesterase [Kiritimatiellae bacterium]|nr:metallophosphoesterase [Kiritimatiellia bacterium]
MNGQRTVLCACVAGALLTAQAQIEAVWLTHRSATPEKTVVSWKSMQAGASTVLYGADTTCGQTASIAGDRVLHHVEIDTPQSGTTVFYRVETGEQKSETRSFQTCPEDGVRVAIIGDWGYAGKPDLTALKADKPHMLMTAGDNVPHVTNPKQAGDKTYIQPFLELLKSEADLFAATPFMPIIGNHDKQVGPRVNKRPGASSETYDIDATAYLSVFALPGVGWRWAFTIPQVDVTFLALDMHHLSDFGTTFQTCHDFHHDSEQFKWYDEQTSKTTSGFVVTLLNASSQCRNLEQGAWHEMFSRGTVSITGFGYYAERAVEENGFPYYNTCVAKPGDVYRDPKAVICERASSYMLLTFDRAKKQMTVDLKRLDGSVIDTQVYCPKERRAGAKTI